jgi:uncharacterized protein (TIGR03084 family)
MTQATLERVLADLVTESDALDHLVAPLDPAGWRAPTPAAGWTVGHQITHLAWTDEAALHAVVDPLGFGRWLADLVGRYPIDQLVDLFAEPTDPADPTGLLARWRAARAQLTAALRVAPADARVPWFGPPMAPASLATARLMETWAHGEDVAAALGVRREPTDRLWHVARLAVRTRDFAFGLHHLPAPTEPIRVELTAPDGDAWVFGPPDAAQRVTGPALDFCLLAVQRRHRRDTALAAVGAQADAWLDVVQAFAGPPGQGRSPLETSGRSDPTQEGSTEESRDD